MGAVARDPGRPQVVRAGRRRGRDRSALAEIDPRYPELDGPALDELRAARAELEAEKSKGV